jgi:uncharacterized OB-fold protein
VSPEPRPIHEGLFVDGPEGPRLVAGRCAGCGALHFPAGPTCPYCGADGCGVAHVGPEGRLRLFTAVRSRPPGYRGALPYGFGVVELAGGLAVITRITEADPGRLRQGMPMTLVLEPLHAGDDGRPVVSWAFRSEGA